MRRYWIEKKMLHEEFVIFKDELFHHIFDVCRQEVGHHFEVLTEDSKAYLVEVISKEKKQAKAVLQPMATKAKRGNLFGIKSKQFGGEVGKNVKSQ